MEKLSLQERLQGTLIKKPFDYLVDITCPKEKDDTSQDQSAISELENYLSKKTNSEGNFSLFDFLNLFDET